MKIMLIEDEVILAMATQAMLEGMGHEVCGPYHNSDNIKNFFIEDNPDLLITDFMLAKKSLNGVEVAKEILKIKNVPILFITAYPQEELMLVENALSHADFLSKPFSKSNLIEIIESIVEREKIREKI